MKRIRKHLRDALPEIIGGLIVAAILWVIALIDTTFGVQTILLSVLGVAWGVFGYIAFKKKLKPGISGSRRGRRAKLGTGGSHWRDLLRAYASGTWEYPKYRRLAFLAFIVLPILTVSAVGYNYYRATLPPEKTSILIARFESPDADDQFVTRTLYEQLSSAMASYNDVEVVLLDQSFQDSEEARKVGNDRKATILIWGSYGDTGKIIPISTNFEILRDITYLPELEPVAHGEIQPIPREQFESFTFQLQLSQDTTYLSHFTIGMTRFSAGQWDDALVNLNKALEALNEVSGSSRFLSESIVYTHRGFLHIYTNNFELALLDLDRAIALDPTNGDAFGIRGLLFMYTAKYDHALADLNQAILLQPQSVSHYINRGSVYLLTGQNENALSDLNFAISQDVGDEKVYYNRGLVFLAQNALDKALSDFDYSIRLDAHNPKALRKRGLVHLRLGNYQQAIDNFNKSLRIDDNNAESYHNRGIAYFEIGDSTRAFSDIGKSIELDPSNAVYYYNQGCLYRRGGDYVQAIRDLTKALSLQENYYEAYNCRGDSYLSLRKFQEAIADYEQLTVIAPLLSEPYRKRAEVHAQMKNFDLAIADYSRAIELNPYDYLAYHDRATVYGDKGDYVKSLADLNKALELQPKNATALFNRAIAYIRLDQPENALIDLNKAAELNTDPSLEERIQQELRDLQ